MDRRNQKDYADMVEMSVRDNRTHEVTFFEGEIGGRGDQQARPDKPIRAI